MFKDFRDYLDYLEKNKMLVRVKKKVDPRFEIAAGIRKISDTDGPALLFENVKGYPNWRVAGGVFATQKLMALALQTDDDENKILERYLEFDHKRVKPKLVSTGPVKEVIIKGDDVDLSKLPMPTYCERDVGPYLTAGVEIAKDPETGIQDTSIVRRKLLSKDRLSLSMALTRGIAMMITAAEQKGQGLGVATVMGVHPALTIASQGKALRGVDEVEIAGALRGEPLEMVKCETIDVEVPADAEVVVETVTVPGERVDDGPFGEYPGNYLTMGDIFFLTGKPAHPAFVTKVTAITMRKDPIFQAMLTGMPMTENHCLKKWAYAAAIYRSISNVVPDVKDIKGINLTPGGGACYHVVISIHKRFEATARSIIYTTLASTATASLVTVVDEDINIYDPSEVEWAITTRVQPDRDIIILPTVLPPPGSAALPVYMHKWGIDATKPMIEDRSLYDRAVPPGVEKVDYV